MQLYLISKDESILTRWESLLPDLHPKRANDLNEIVQTDVSVMLMDNALPKSLTHFMNRVLVLSMTPNYEDAQKYLQMGAMGYGNAMMHQYHLHSAYQALEEGKVWLHPDFISEMIAHIRDKNDVKSKTEKSSILASLSIREQEVAQMLGDGATQQEIADALDITIRTVKAHATSIYQKLEVKDRLALSLLLHS